MMYTVKYTMPCLLTVATGLFGSDFLQAGRILTNRAPIAQTAKQQLKIAYNEVP